MEVWTVKKTRLLLLLPLLLSQSSCLVDQCEAYIRKHDVQLEIRDEIQDRYFGINSRDRGLPMIKLAGRRDVIETDLYTLVCYAQSGDTLIKHKGTLRYQVKRGDHIEDFFPECGNITILDDNQTRHNPSFSDDCGKRREE